MKRELEEERMRLVEAKLEGENNLKKKEAVLRSIEEKQAELEATKVTCHNFRKSFLREKKQKKNTAMIC